MDLGMLVLSSILDRHFLKSVIRSIKIMCNRSVCFISPVSVPQSRSSLVAPAVGDRARIWILVHIFFSFLWNWQSSKKIINAHNFTKPLSQALTVVMVTFKEPA
jgi:hypothetical protein